MNHLNVSKESAAFWRVSISNPPVNLVNSRFIIDMHELLDAAEADSDLKVIVFESANPDYFLAHWDLTDDMSLLADHPEPGAGPKFPFAFMDMVVRLSKLPALTITSLRGRARGAGSEFVLATDITFASRERTLIGQFEMTAMAPPGGGAPSRLARLIGRNRALEVLIGAEDFTGPQAELYGYVNRAVPDDELDEFVTAFANRVARFDRTSLIQLKQWVNEITLPEDNELQPQGEAFGEALSRPAFQNWVTEAFARGLQQPGELEENLGAKVPLSTQPE
ncbi:enoyl-CoA hydratase/isomerase family protein [uncultured Arthrobacter sp.]|uniref:enoyl-CoA hydratase/isomerase family protein n=1 Tax=uncultured Arthrobacter sp. TaxID=114050 RepID=UPI0028D57BF5|nr:enoyl-CoA hydratase/isomerase family protein [uncultured Arthrobacter sp.]